MAYAVYLAFNDPQKIDQVFPAAAKKRAPEYEERPYWGPHAVADEAA